MTILNEMPTFSETIVFHHIRTVQLAQHTTTYIFTIFLIQWVHKGGHAMWRSYLDIMRLLSRQRLNQGWSGGIKFDIFVTFLSPTEQEKGKHATLIRPQATIASKLISINILTEGTMQYRSLSNSSVCIIVYHLPTSHMGPEKPRWHSHL